LTLHGFLRRIMRPDLTRTTTVRPAEEPRLPRATYRAPISRGPEQLTTHITHITHHFRRPGAPYHAYHAYHAPFPSASRAPLPRISRISRTISVGRQSTLTTHITHITHHFRRPQSTLTTHTTHITHHFRRPPWPARQSRELRGRDGTTTGATPDLRQPSSVAVFQSMHGRT
jgi:hypothetical protein